jgi:hypothetical protein
MAHKSLFIALAALLVLAPGAGMAERIEEGEVVYYTIVKDDTLWDITDRFFEDPYRWPVLWKRNPYIKNPHLIFPGDVLKITPDGIKVVKRGEKVEELPVIKLPPPPVEEAPPVVEEPPVIEEILPPPPPAEEAPPPAVKKVTSHLMAREGFITKKELEESGAIASAKEKKVYFHEDDEVFLSFRDPGAVREGDRFAIFKVGEEILHPLTKKPLGNLFENLGSLEITKVGDVIEGRIDNSYKEITAEAKLTHFEEPVKEVDVVEAKTKVRGVIVASLDGAEIMGEGDVAFIDKGERDGLEEGNILEIYRERTPVKDPLRKRRTITLPPRELGTLVVIDVRERVSTAIILNSFQPIMSGDQVITPGFVD